MRDFVSLMLVHASNTRFMVFQPSSILFLILVVVVVCCISAQAFVAVLLFIRLSKLQNLPIKYSGPYSLAWATSAHIPQHVQTLCAANCNAENMYSTTHTDTLAQQKKRNNAIVYGNYRNFLIPAFTVSCSVAYFKFMYSQYTHTRSYSHSEIFKWVISLAFDSALPNRKLNRLFSLHFKWTEWFSRPITDKQINKLSQHEWYFSIEYNLNLTKQ